MTNPTHTITGYTGNRLDSPVTVGADELADEFLRYVESDEFEATRPSVQFAFRWWVSGPPPMRNLALDADDLEAVETVLSERFHADQPMAERICNRVYGEGS